MLFKKTCLFTTLTVLGVIWSHAVFAELPFKFVIDRWGGYQLEYQGKSYSLQIDYEGFVAPKGNSEDFPNHLLPVINIVNLFFDLPYDGPAKDFYLFRERKFLGTSKELLEIVKDRFGTEGISQEEYVSYAIKACLVHTNRNCLRDLVSGDITPKQEGQIYLYLGLLADDWVEQKKYFSKALVLSHGEPGIRFITNLFSLAVAEEVLSVYEEQLKKYKTFRRLDMDELGEKTPTYWESFLQALLNTTHAITMLTSNYEDDLMAVWEEQLDQVSMLKFAIRELRKIMENEGKELSEILPKIDEYPNLTIFAPYLRGFQNSSFVREVIEYGIFFDQMVDGEEIHYPSIESLGIRIDLDFVGKDWKTVTIGQINILNAWMFFRGPAAAEAFGKTALGVWTIRVLHLRKLVSALSKLPYGLNKLSLFIAVETADGCVVRWIYTGIVVNNQISEGGSLTPQLGKQNFKKTWR